MYQRRAIFVSGSPMNIRIVLTVIILTVNVESYGAFANASIHRSRL